LLKILISFKNIKWAQERKIDRKEKGDFRDILKF
jgi:hypothetical protein